MPARITGECTGWTGSQKFRMMKDVSDSLAGRVAVFDLAALSSAEIENRTGRVFSSGSEISPGAHGRQQAKEYPSNI